MEGGRREEGKQGGKREERGLISRVFWLVKI